MKKSLLFGLSAITLLLVFSNRAYSIKHVVNVQNYAFVPANLTVQVGDTIRWVWINGSHTTTSTSVPTGASTWDEPITSSNPFYEYRVNVAGVYDYLCTPHSSTQIGHFTATNPTPTLSVTPLNQNVSASAGSTNFSVSSNSNWTASSSESWCTVTSSGAGNGNLVANYSANTSASQRIATITVSVAGAPNSTVTVTQAGFTPSLSVTPSNQSVSSTSGSTNFSITSNTTWTAASDQNWCTVTTSGTGNSTLVANYTANSLSTQRIATITVSVAGLPNSTVTVTQAGSSTLDVFPLNQDVTSAAGSASFGIVSNTDWTVTSNASWVSMPSSGSGNATLLVNYEENTEIETRIAAIIINVTGASVEVTLTQAGAATILEVSPLNQNVTYEAGSTTFNITSNANWTALSPDPWISSTSDGTGNGILRIDYTENTSSEVRVSTITVAAPEVIQMITVTQEGSISVADNSLKGVKIFPNPSTGIVEITSENPGLSVMKVMDLKGNVLLEEEVNNLSTYKLNLTSMAKGTYIFRLDNDAKSYINRIVLVK